MDQSQAQNTTTEAKPESTQTRTLAQTILFCWEEKKRGKERGGEDRKRRGEEERRRGEGRGGGDRKKIG